MLSLRAAFENLTRNFASALPAILMIAVLTTLFHSTLTLHSKATETLDLLRQKFSLTVYLKDDADPFQAGNLISALEKRRDVATVVYTSKEAAFKEMSKTFSFDPALLERYKFSLPASITVTLEKPEDGKSVEQFIQSEAPNLLKPEAFAKDKAQQDLLEKTGAFVARLREGTVGAVFLFLILTVVIASLSIATTIHLAFVTRHREMSIMKLVGASRKHMMKPFLIEALLIIGAAFCLHLIFSFLIAPGPLTTRFHLNAFVIELFVLLLLSALVSYATVALHLRRHSFFS